MKIPNKITILGITFKVIQIDGKKMTDKFNMNVHGLMDWHAKTIYIQKDIPNDEKYLTFIHECTHCMHYIIGLNQVISPELQEIICETTAHLIDDLTRRK